MDKIIIQITSGRGPIECCRVVARVQEMMLGQASKKGIAMHTPLQWNPKEVLFETCRASGPGGQNVNKVETAVRGTHIPSGIQVLAMDSRSQLQNKKLCLQRLEEKVRAWQTSQLISQQQARWQEHNCLERGNAVKTIMAGL